MDHIQAAMCAELRRLSATCGPDPVPPPEGAGAGVRVREDAGAPPMSRFRCSAAAGPAEGALKAEVMILYKELWAPQAPAVP